MAKINDIIARFDEFKPAIAERFVQTVTSQHAALLRDLERNGKTAAHMSSEYAHSWGALGYVYRNLVRRFTKVVNGKTDYAQLDTEYLAKQAKNYADDQVAAFTIKLVKKLGDLNNVEVIHLSFSQFTFEIKGTLGTREVYVEQNIVQNVSSQGNPYLQWPARIKVDGKFTPEAKFKLLAKEVAP